MTVKRVDQPDLRSEHAAATRARVLRAARTLFAEAGYSATTIAALAEEAGVAVQTLYSAFGSKGGLALAVMQDAVASSGINEAMGAALREPDGAKAIRILAVAAARLHSLEAPLFKLFSAEVAADFGRISDRHRLQNFKDLAASPGFAPHFDSKQEAEQAAVATWAVVGVESYDRLVIQAGWSHHQYERWLIDTITANLLPHRRT
jgi:TetR/AcrR family transcriptional regulator, regulator of autoinduction and epiphytic fitness